MRLFRVATVLEGVWSGTFTAGSILISQRDRVVTVDMDIEGAARRGLRSSRSLKAEHTCRARRELACPAIVMRGS